MIGHRGTSIDLYGHMEYQDGSASDDVLMTKRVRHGLVIRIRQSLVLFMWSLPVSDRRAVERPLNHAALSRL